MQGIVFCGGCSYCCSYLYTSILESKHFDGRGCKFIFISLSIATPCLNTQCVKYFSQIATLGIHISVSVCESVCVLRLSKKIENKLFRVAYEKDCFIIHAPKLLFESALIKQQNLRARSWPQNVFLNIIYSPLIWGIIYKTRTMFIFIPS